MMHFSKTWRSSPHCLPSPDGKLIATLLLPPTTITIRAVQSGLSVANDIRLPTEFSGPVVGFQWSPSSRHLLVATADQIRVLSALDDTFQGVVRNAVPPGAKLAYMAFGASDAEVCVCSSLGLKFAVFDLGSSKAVEVANPKFFAPSTAGKGFSFRPHTYHLALLTRTSGKDMISIHDFPTRKVLRSWTPDTVDAQSLVWSPDGRWLVVCESPGQGHKVIFYTPDGHIFKIWSGPSHLGLKDRDYYSLGTGVKTLQFSADGLLLAVGDRSRCTHMFEMAAVAEVMRLQHPTVITPRDTLQVWQEQVSIAQTGLATRTFIRAAQALSPTGVLSKEDAGLRSGCVSILFDCSSALVATRLEENPSTVWIWDARASELRAVMLFNDTVSDLSWHPTLGETLLIACEGGQYGHGVVFVWDPLSGGPRSVDYAEIFPAPKTPNSNKFRALWLNLESAAGFPSPLVFISDSQKFLLVSPGEVGDDQSLPWSDAASLEWTNSASRREEVEEVEESPLGLVPVPESAGLDAEYGEDDEGSASELEDTFIHKR